jgi:bacterioferritin (cytochrome b1)
MTDSLNLLNNVIEKELDSSIRYIWQSLMAENSDLRDTFGDSAIEKLEQVMKIGKHIFKHGDIPSIAPKDVDKPLKEMIEVDLKAENDVIRIYQEIIEKAKKERDTATRLLCEEILKKEQERKHVLMCARGRASTKLI